MTQSTIMFDTKKHTTANKSFHRMETAIIILAAVVLHITWWCTLKQWEETSLRFIDKYPPQHPT